MSDHRIIRDTLGDIAPNKRNWDGFRASIRRRIVGFKGKDGTPYELECTEAFIRTVITTAFEENCPITEKTTGDKAEGNRYAL